MVTLTPETTAPSARCALGGRSPPVCVPVTMDFFGIKELQAVPSSHGHLAEPEDVPAEPSASFASVE